MKNESVEMQKVSESNYIDFKLMLAATYYYKFFIASLTLLFAVLSVIYALSLNNVYTSSATLNVVQSESAEGLGTLAGRLGGLASLAGVSLGSPGLDSSTRVLSTFKSVDFLSQFIDQYSLHDEIIAGEGWDRESNEIIYDNDLYIPSTDKWVRTPKQLQSIIPTSFEASQKFLEEHLNLKLDIETGLIRMSVSYYSPGLAKLWLEKLIEMLNVKLRNKDIEEIQKSLSFLKEQVSIVSNSDIKTQLYELMQERTEKLMFAKARDEYAVSIIDSPYLPEEKTKPARAIICIVITMLGFFISFSVSIFLFVNKKK